jgi:hypothetical protein
MSRGVSRLQDQPAFEREPDKIRQRAVLVRVARDHERRAIRWCALGRHVSIPSWRHARWSIAYTVAGEPQAGYRRRAVRARSRSVPHATPDPASPSADVSVKRQLRWVVYLVQAGVACATLRSTAGGRTAHRGEEHRSPRRPTSRTQRPQAGRAGSIHAATLHASRGLKRTQRGLLPKVSERRRTLTAPEGLSREGLQP